PRFRRSSRRRAPRRPACRSGRAPHTGCPDRERNRPRRPDSGREGGGPAAKGEYRAVLAGARREAKRLPRARAELLQKVLADVAAQWRGYTRPRALVLFSTLAFNGAWLANHAVWGDHPDRTGEDGVVYRFFWSHGYVFHPLANFAKLN